MYTHCKLQIDGAGAELDIRHLGFARRFMLGVREACVYASDTIGMADRTPSLLLAHADWSEFNHVELTTTDLSLQIGVPYNDEGSSGAKG